eukprot:g2267.t1
MSRGTLILVSKLPTLGKSKTRLIPRLGQAAALELATAMLTDLLQRLGSSPTLRCVDKVLLFAPGDAGDAAARLLRGCGQAGAWSARPMLSGAQQSLTASDLGAKLAAALCEEQREQAARAHTPAPVAFIGMDSPVLPTEAIACALRAAGATGGRDAYICGATDGGYTLLALPASCPADVFAGVQWSCACTRESQEARLAACGLRVRRGDTYDDIDEFEDVAVLARRLAAAPATAQAVCPTVDKVLRRVIKTC